MLAPDYADAVDGEKNHDQLRARFTTWARLQRVADEIDASLVFLVWPTVDAKGIDDALIEIGKRTSWKAQYAGALPPEIEAVPLNEYLERLVWFDGGAKEKAEAALKEILRERIAAPMPPSTCGLPVRTAEEARDRNTEIARRRTGDQSVFVCGPPGGGKTTAFALDDAGADCSIR